MLSGLSGAAVGPPDDSVHEDDVLSVFPSLEAGFLSAASFALGLLSCGRDNAHTFGPVLASYFNNNHLYLKRGSG